MDKEIVKLMREAVKQGDLDLIKKLHISNEGLINIDTVFGSWLHVASAHGQIEIVEYLIKCGLNVNQNGDISGGTPIRSAAENGHLDIIELLYQNGAKFDVSEATRNPLFGAICNGHYEVAKFLIDKGIDITASYSIGKLDNVDAYEYARQFGQLEIAEYIKEKLKGKK
ncbi:MAG: ankyrin repeat domain-containing protein [Bacteroidales bacterium]|nr:ankyrin repeat domain-containing protein [Clostridium sp.]MCM1203865.1 ankyrin repeat domain-containing protein [Bacteroidales bacterium]